MTTLVSRVPQSIASPLGAEASLDDPTLELRYWVPTSFLMEFAAGHSHPAVMKELVQNQYDAGGGRMELAFKQDQLVVSGHGVPVSHDGWQRLGVMMGTGEVPGTGQSIGEKTNGIGSKNFGLRSLFLYGDRIKIYSGGRKTVLDLARGTLPKPLPDPGSRGRRGIRIEVPYRTSRDEKVPPFGPDDEERALNALAGELAPMLLKLAHPKAPKSLRDVLITSTRCQRRIAWKQTAEVIGRRVGVTIVRRRIRVTDSRAPVRRALEEIEFQRVLPVPADQRSRTIPGYYRAPGGRVRLAVSLRLDRFHHVDVNAPGIFSYPLGIGEGFTGTAIGVSAPFHMDTDRSQMRDPTTDVWNHWLLDEAVDFTLDVLTSDWLDRFGADAYLALRHLAPPAPAYYAERLQTRLFEEAFWPTRAHVSGHSKRPVFTCLSKVVLPDTENLNGFLDDEHALDDRLEGNSGLRALALEHGAKRFGVDSLVRLRCAGRDASKLATKIDAQHEATFYYSAFPVALKDVDRQVRFAKALQTEEKRKHLSPQNRQDLAETLTTLSAAEQLEAPAHLYDVDPSVTNGCPVPPTRRLHPSLAGFTVLAHLCEQFDSSDWLDTVARQAQSETLTAEEREAAYRYIISPQRRVARATWRALRSVAILRDHRGEWVSATALTLPTAPGADLLAATLQFPHPDYAHDTQLARALPFKRCVTGDDIVAHARLVSTEAAPAAGLLEALPRLTHALTSKVVERLRTIAFLPSSRGDLAAPSALYLNTLLNRACLGSGALFVAGPQSALYRRLGCRAHPQADDIVAHLRELQQTRRKPIRPHDLYPALVEALRREGRPLTTYRDRPILSYKQGYCMPSETLLTDTYRDVFLDALPQIAPTNDVVRDAYLQLGAVDKPQEQHWKRLFMHIGDKYEATANPVSPRERDALRRAYSTLQELPEGVPENTKCLLDDRGRVHALSEARTGRYAINDDDSMAQTVREQRVPLAFADLLAGNKQRLMRFYRMSGVRELTDVRQRMGAVRGAESLPPQWLTKSRVNVQQELKRLRSAAFTSAVDTLVAHTLRRHAATNPSPRTRLKAIRRIAFVDVLQAEYAVDSLRILVPTTVAVEEHTILLTGVGSRAELRGLLAQAIASLYTDATSEQRGLADAIFRLITCRSSLEMQRYLTDQRGLTWQIPVDVAEDGEDDEEEEGDDAAETLAGAQEHTAIASTLTAGFVDRVQRGSGRPSAEAAERATVPSAPSRSGEETAPAPATHPLPPLDTVTVRRVEPIETWTPASPRSRGGGHAGSWSPPLVNSGERREKEIGLRGEEIAYRTECERVRRLGLPESRVIWTARDGDEYADHDILSVGDEGQPVYLEVKSTSGKGGRFYWPRAEFEKAVRERERYQLWRVYEADTDHPCIRVFADPIGLMLRNGMRVDLGTLVGEVAPLEALVQVCGDATGTANGEGEGEGD